MGVRLCSTLNAACTQISLFAPSQAREHMHNDVNWNTDNTDQIMAFIERATHSPPPSMVDSAGVAGLIGE